MDFWDKCWRNYIGEHILRKANRPLGDSLKFGFTSSDMDPCLSTQRFICPESAKFPFIHPFTVCLLKTQFFVEKFTLFSQVSERNTGWSRGWPEVIELPGFLLFLLFSPFALVAGPEFGLKSQCKVNRSHCSGKNLKPRAESSQLKLSVYSELCYMFDTCISCTLYNDFLRLT